MAVGGTGYSSAQPRQYDPSYLLSTAPLRTWGTTGNTDTVIDATCTAGCFIDLSSLSATPAGFWKVVAGNGSFVVTSSDSESAGLTYYYRIRA